MTQEDLAEAVDTKASVISLLENGNRRLSDKWAYRLAPALRARPGWLLDFDPNTVPTDILDLWAEIPDESKPQARSILETFRRPVAAAG